jgi:hypothetical protein
VQLIVQVTPEVAQARREEARSAQADALHAAAARLGLRLEPLDPGSTDPELRRYLVADVPDAAAGDAAAAELAGLPGVEGAYLRGGARTP